MTAINPHLETVIEPLSEATRNALKQLQLRDGDALDIWMEDGKFAIRPMFFDFELGEERKFWFGSFSLKRFVSNLPDSTPEDDYYLVGATDYNVILLHHAVESHRLKFRGEESRLLFSYLLRRFITQGMRAKVQADFKLLGHVPEYPYRLHPDNPLSDYQKIPVLMGVGQEGQALFCDRGTGKTAIAISRICAEVENALKKSDERMLRVLVVCPKKARVNWQKEFAKFSTYAAKATVIRGDQVKRIRLLTHGVKTETNARFAACITSYDTASSDIDILEKISWDIVICDESHYFKSSKTKRWKTLRRLRECSNMRLALTGTPIANTLMDIWTQLEFLGEGFSGFSSEKAFRDFHIRFEDGVAADHGIKRIAGYENIPLFKERLARLSFSIDKEEAGLNLPDKVRDVVEVQMTLKQRDIYKNLAEKLAHEVEEDIAKAKPGDKLVVNHILTKLLRLAQITSGFVKWDARYDETGECISEARIEQIDGIDANPKLCVIRDMLQENFEDDSRSKAIIWACFREDVEALAKMCASNGIGHRIVYGKVSENARLEAESAFNNDPSCKVFIGIPKAAGDALNLLGYDPNKADDAPGNDTYCNHEIYMSCNWSMIDRLQSEDRAHRRGTRMPVRITDVIVPGTIDPEIRDRVSFKEEQAVSLTDLSGMLKNLLDTSGIE